MTNLKFLLFYTGFLISNVCFSQTFTCTGKFDGPCKGVAFRYDAEHSTRNRYLNLQGKVKEMLCINYKAFSDSEIVAYTLFYRFDSGGKMIERTQRRANGKFNVQTFYKYNKNNDLIEEISYDQDSVKFETRKVFHRKGNVVIDSCFKPNESIMYIGKDTYDSRGYKLRTESYWMYNRQTNWTNYMYNKRGILTEQHGTWGGRASGIVYLHDNDGNTIGSFDPAVKDTTIDDVKFDTWGNEIWENKRLEYDGQNNWIRRFRADKLQEERKIVYY